MRWRMEVEDGRWWKMAKTSSTSPYYFFVSFNDTKKQKVEDGRWWKMIFDFLFRIKPTNQPPPRRLVFFGSYG